mmetsp:Transcript_44287/g.73865  ORF Transcript_44287/g.73865 Transcript_44287/m.73865 type:complete len:91 (+) Transcript_44287:300-572(+)
MFAHSSCSPPPSFSPTSLVWSVDKLRFQLYSAFYCYADKNTTTTTTMATARQQSTNQPTSCKPDSVGKNDRTAVFASPLPGISPKSTSPC